jgi:hypothetical protein
VEDGKVRGKGFAVLQKAPAHARQHSFFRNYSNEW